MTGQLVLYTNPMSRGRIARWMLEEVGQPYSVEVVAYGPPMKSAAYRAVNPMGKVPALKHGDRIVTECAAICAYLAEAFPQAGLAPPPGDPLRADFLRWMFFAAGPVEAATTNAALGVIPPADRAGMVGYGSVELVTQTLAEALAGKSYFLGERFSAVDVYLGSQIGWAMQFKTLPPSDVLGAYAARIQSRPAAIAAREKDDALGASPP